jgi:uncharacterized membrane protein YdcZ (DUF606 family)
MAESFSVMFPEDTGPVALFDLDRTVGERFLRTTPNCSHFSVATDFMLTALKILKIKEADNLEWELEWEHSVHTDTTYGLCGSMYVTVSCMYSKRAGVTKTVFVTPGT